MPRPTTIGAADPQRPKEPSDVPALDLPRTADLLDILTRFSLATGYQTLGYLISLAHAEARLQLETALDVSSESGRL